MTVRALGDSGWRSKTGWRGKAHYVLGSGRTACAGSIGPRGVPMGDLIRCGWRELDPDDHLCGLCVKKYPMPCRCGVCRVKPAPVRISGGEEVKR